MNELASVTIKGDSKTSTLFTDEIHNHTHSKFTSCDAFDARTGWRPATIMFQLITRRLDPIQGYVQIHMTFACCQVWLIVDEIFSSSRMTNAAVRRRLGLRLWRLHQKSPEPYKHGKHAVGKQYKTKYTLSPRADEGQHNTVDESVAQPRWEQNVKCYSQCILYFKFVVRAFETSTDRHYWSI